MGAQVAAGVRVVLDTNIVVSALVFSGGNMARIRELWTEGRILPLVCRASAHELVAALTYPKFALDNDDIQTMLAAYLPFTEAVTVPNDAIVDVPTCRDSGDQMFLRLAAVGRARALVTGDRALLELAPRAPFAIETATQFVKRFA